MNTVYMVVGVILTLVGCHLHDGSVANYASTLLTAYGAALMVVAITAPL